jgi:tetratricopeptide (TPR) repeat protein
MYDMKPLEDEWKKYKKKKLKPWYIVFFIFLFFILIVFAFLNTQKIDFNWFDMNFNRYVNKEKNDNSIQISKIVVNGPIMKLEIEKKVVSMVNNSEVKNSPNILVDIPILNDIQKPINNTTQLRKKINMNIVESSSINAYKDVENRFRQSRDVDDALFLAKSYYKKGNYAKAEYWALETNKVDENIEDSLLIFVKSKTKLGRKNEAIGILMSYVKKTDSIEAKNLLYKIKNGKF